MQPASQRLLERDLYNRLAADQARDALRKWEGFVADITWISACVAVSGRVPPACAARAGDELAIRRIVDVRAEERDDAALLARHGVAFLWLPTRDHEPLSPADLRLGTEWVRSGIARGERVLIHCQHGIGRSALLAACVLVADGRSPSDALRLIKRQRSKVSPSPSQLHALLQFAAEWSARVGATCPSTEWDDLAAIAYGL